MITGSARTGRLRVRVEFVQHEIERVEQLIVREALAAAQIK
jgi:hypothetical protein